MNITLRIPTKEPYAYIEVSTEGGSVEEAYQAYKEITRMVAEAPGTGLGRTEWNKLIDALLIGEGMNTEQFEGMSDKQKEFYHEVEKALARLKSKNLIADND